MSITNFFQVIGNRGSEVVPHIDDATNREKEEVTKQLKKLEDKPKGRRKYRTWTVKEKVEIGNYATQNGVAAAVRKFSEQYPTLSKQSVSDFKKVAKENSRQGSSVMTGKKRGRPSLLPNDLMKKTINMVEALRLNGAPVTSEVINSVAKGIIEANDRSILIENGGYLSLSQQWGRNVLYRMEKENKKMCRRKATTEKIPIAPGLLKEAKFHFQRKIKQIQAWHNIPDELILNFDQTPLSYICSPNHTLHVKGAKNVPLVGKGEKNQITGTFTCTKSGLFLPMQLIYEGKTDRCHPRGTEFPDGFNITHTDNHWSNEDKVVEHLEVIVFPYLRSMREELGLPDAQKALLIYDVFKGQKTQRVVDLIEDNGCLGVYVPPNLTHVFQPLDLTINGNAKEFLKNKFSEWYARQITQELEKGETVYNIEINTNLTVMKPIHARWVIGLYDHLRNRTELIKKGFDEAGITEAVEKELDSLDPFDDLD